ncbi:Uncharacterized protein APZ42_017074 [Daphnia magna]|uniref:Uncharacterized protein n=1 Tax=Daphnia magna TaxID=35525 RepID=A0A165A1K8_9CRUS|nr:Uncharacterized protein APZ42_017074 [Daphnia magna]
MPRRRILITYISSFPNLYSVIERHHFQKGFRSLFSIDVAIATIHLYPPPPFNLRSKAHNKGHPTSRGISATNLFQ